MHYIVYYTYTLYIIYTDIDKRIFEIEITTINILLPYKRSIAQVQIS